MIEQIHSEAFILKSVPYGESDRILTLFCRELGVISAYLQGKSAPWIQGLSLIEAGFSEGKGDLYKLKEPKLLNPYFFLRDQFPLLKTAMQLFDFIHKYLPEHLEKPQIYALLKVYLDRLKIAKNPENYLYSFILKTLFAEGVLEVGEKLISEEFELPGYLAPLVTGRKFDEIEAVTLENSDKEILLTFF